MATLQDSDTTDIHFGDPMTVYDIDGHPHTFTPCLNVSLCVLGLL
jgi:hypothetical protein